MVRVCGNGTCPTVPENVHTYSFPPWKVTVNSEEGVDPGGKKQKFMKEQQGEPHIQTVLKGKQKCQRMERENKKTPLRCMDLF